MNLAKNILLSFLLGLFLLVAAYFVAANGHGTFSFAKLVFPYTLLSTMDNNPITGIYVLLALIQFPLYSFVYLKSKRSDISLLALLAIHALFVVLAFMYSGALFV